MVTFHFDGYFITFIFHQNLLTFGMQTSFIYFDDSISKGSPVVLPLLIESSGLLNPARRPAHGVPLSVYFVLRIKSSRFFRVFQ